MTRHRRNKNEFPLSLQFITIQEQHIFKQKEFIAELLRKGRSTLQAEAALGHQLRMLARLRDHSETMRELMKPSLYQNGLREQSI